MLPSLEHVPYLELVKIRKNRGLENFLSGTLAKHGYAFGHALYRKIKNLSRGLSMGPSTA